MHILLDAITHCLQEPAFQERIANRQLRFISYGWHSDRNVYRGLPVQGFGHVDSEEKMALLYAAADVYICPTIEDNLPNTILEAMSCGTPVLASDVGGVPDMIIHRGNGLLVKPGDAVELAAALKWILENPGTLREWAVRARQRVEANFTIQLQANRFMELYAGLLKGGGAIREKSIVLPTSKTLPLIPAAWEVPGGARGKSY
ncbi:MAG: glycosyltransferase [Verrucomicrobiota bacterium]